MSQHCLESVRLYNNQSVNYSNWFYASKPDYNKNEMNS